MPLIAVKRFIQTQIHSFRLLLYLEWILLGMTALTEVVHDPLRHSPQFSLLRILSLAGFGVMGLRLPAGKLIDKVLYTCLEFALILTPIIIDSHSIRFLPLLCLVVVIRSCLIFKPPGRLIVAGVALMSFLLTLFFRADIPHATGRPMVQEQLRFTVLILKLNAALLFGLAMVFVLLLINALLAERQSREKLMLANEQLRQYALRIKDQATLEERNRIARDIHDSLGHFLTALNIQLEGALKLWESNPARSQKFLAEAKRLGSSALQEVRQSVSILRSDPVQGGSLESAIASLVKETYDTTGVLPNYSINLERPLPIEISTAVYRVVQEALTNIYKHAAATEVQITLNATTTELSLVIQDNGRGFKVDQNTTGFGLQGMRERATAVEAQFDIESEPGCGCRITVNFPLNELTKV